MLFNPNTMKKQKISVEYIDAIVKEQELIQKKQSKLSKFKRDEVQRVFQMFIDRGVIEIVIDD